MLNQNILVCGGSGFIGTNLIYKLLKVNFTVINIDRQSYSSVPEKFKEYRKNKKYFFYKLNINNTKKIEKIILKKKINIILNLANDSHVDRSIDNPKKFLISNINSNIKFLNLLIKLQKKRKFFYIHFSTDEVYGDYKFYPNKETDRLEPNSPYSASKASIEMILNSFNRTYNFKYILIRTCNQFGKFQFTEKFIPTIINCLIKKKSIPIYGNGKNIREWLDVETFSKIITHLLNKKEKLNSTQILNIGSNIRISNKNLCIKIIRLFEKINKNNFRKNKFRYIKDRPGHDRYYSLNTKKFFKLNISNKFNFEKKLEDTIKWYLENKKWIKYTEKKHSGKRLGLKLNIKG